MRLVTSGGRGVKLVCGQPTMRERQSTPYFRDRDSNSNRLAKVIQFIPDPVTPTKHSRGSIMEFFVLVFSGGKPPSRGLLFRCYQGGLVYNTNDSLYFRCLNSKALGWVMWIIDGFVERDKTLSFHSCSMYNCSFEPSISMRHVDMASYFSRALPTCVTL